MDGNTINGDVTMSGAAGALLAGRYRVVRQLGQGGMGSVWLAEDMQLDSRKVAVKMLPSILVSNKRAYNQLKAEALVSLKLTHSNIATVRAFEENGGNPFLVVDYIDGQTLDDYLAEKGKLTEEETIRLLSPVAAALDYAHGEGVVHRDVKPANVMIRKDGHPFVLDFGIAREIQETLTRVTGKLSSGTLLYMSPEQLNGDAPKAAQDIYSFSAMAYECLTGAPPFSRGDVEFQIMNKEPAPLDPHIAISGSVMAGLNKDSEKRPSSCCAVLASRLASPWSGGVADEDGDEDVSSEDDEGEVEDENVEGLMTIQTVEADIQIERNKIDSEYRKLVDYCKVHSGLNAALESLTGMVDGVSRCVIPTELQSAIEFWRNLKLLRKRMSMFIDATKIKGQIESSILPEVAKYKVEVYQANSYHAIIPRLQAGMRFYEEGKYDESFEMLSDIECDLSNIANRAKVAYCKALVKQAVKYDQTKMEDKFNEIVQLGLRLYVGGDSFKNALCAARLKNIVFAASLEGREIQGAKAYLGTWKELPVSIQSFGEPCLIKYRNSQGKHIGVLNASKVDFTKFGSKVLIPLCKKPNIFALGGYMLKSVWGCLLFVSLLIASAFSAAFLFIGIMIIIPLLFDLRGDIVLIMALVPSICLWVGLFAWWLNLEGSKEYCKNHEYIQLPNDDIDER